MATKTFELQITNAWQEFLVANPSLANIDMQLQSKVKDGLIYMTFGDAGLAAPANLDDGLVYRFGEGPPVVNAARLYIRTDVATGGEVAGLTF